MKKALLITAILSWQIGVALAADSTITGLPAATTPLAGSEVFPMDQSGTTVKSTITNVLNVANAYPKTVSGGVSGGIPCFTAITTETASGLLAANSLMIGGGAGVCPSTTTTGTGVLTALGINVGSAGAFVVNGGALGTPSSGTLTNVTGLPISTGVSGLGTGIATALGVNVGSAGAPVINGGALGTPSSGTLTNATGLPISGITGLGTGVGTALGVNVNTAGGIAVPPAALAAGSLVVGGGSGTGPATITLGGDCTFSSPNITCTKSSGSSFGTAAFVNTGTSGATIPLLNAANTWSASQLFTSTAPQIQLGANGGNVGEIQLFGNTSGSLLIVPQAAAGTPTWTAGTGSGTPAVTATAPLAIATSTGNITCTTCATTTNGGALSGTAPIALSAGGAISITGAAGQVLAGASPAFTATPTLGTSGATAGSIAFFGNTSTGTITLNTAYTGASNFTLALPAISGNDTLASLALAQTFTAAKTFPASGLKLTSAGGGVDTFAAASSASDFTLTFPAATDTVAVLGTPQVWSAAQTFSSSDVLIKGSSSGTTALASANTGASNYTLTLPALTSTVVTQGDTATVALSVLATQTNNTVVGNATAGSASPTALAMPSCSGASNALIWTTSTGFGCNTISASGLSFPVTVSGTVTSGGIPYFSSTTNMATSAVLLANNLMIGGGAGAAPSTTSTGTGVLTALGVNVGSAGAFVVNGGALGTPSSGTLTNATGLPISTGVSGLGTGVATFLGTPSSANLASAVTDETGSGALVFGTNPALDGETYSTSATVTAGTNAQGQGALTSDYNVITAASSNPSGVTLPTATTGRRVLIVNKGANAVNVYPASGAAINALAANAAISLPVDGVFEFDASSTTQWYSNSSGSVTSVAQSFTGGLISVGGSPVTTSGTLALTVAGTSGGIPYFSSSSAWASSAALAANAIVLGGGAGAAPATTTTGTGVVTAIGNNVNVNGGLLTASTAAIASNAIVTGAGSGTALTGTTPGTGVLTALGTAVNTNGGPVTASTASIASGAILTGGGSGTAISGITPGTGVASALAVAVNTDGGFATATQTLNAQTGTTYTLVLGDASKMVTLSNASAITLTVPTNASVAFAVGTRIDLAQIGAGQVTVSAAGGVTVSATPGLKLRTQYSGATLIKIDTNTWLLVGDISA